MQEINRIDNDIYVCEWGVSHSTMLEKYPNIKTCIRFMYPLIMVCNQDTEAHMCDYVYERINENIEIDSGYYRKSADYIYRCIVDGRPVLIQFECTVHSSMQAFMALTCYLIKYKGMNAENAMHRVESTYHVIKHLLDINTGDSPVSPPSMSLHFN